MTNLSPQRNHPAMTGWGRLSPKAREGILVGLFIAVSVGAFSSIVDLEPLLVIANGIAWLFTAAIMAWYHRRTDWSETAVGRTTMGIKGAILIALTAGLTRRATALLIAAGAAEAASVVHYVGDVLASTSFILLALVMMRRLAVLRSLQENNETEPEPPSQ